MSMKHFLIKGRRQTVCAAGAMPCSWKAAGIWELSRSCAAKQLGGCAEPFLTKLPTTECLPCQTPGGAGRAAFVEGIRAWVCRGLAARCPPWLPASQPRAASKSGMCASRALEGATPTRDTLRAVLLPAQGLLSSSSFIFPPGMVLNAAGSSPPYLWIQTAPGIPLCKETLQVFSGKYSPCSSPSRALGMEEHDKCWCLLTSPFVLQLCQMVRLVPGAYLEYKAALVNECNKQGGLRLAQARALIKIDVNKTRKIYDFLIREGYITKAWGQAALLGWSRQMWRSFEVALTALKDFTSVEWRTFPFV